MSALTGGYVRGGARNAVAQYFQYVSNVTGKMDAWNNDRETAEADCEGEQDFIREWSAALYSIGGSRSLRRRGRKCWMREACWLIAGMRRMRRAVRRLP